MTTLITGGGSNVGAHLALLLKAAGREAIFASRSGNRIPEGFRNVKLDWKDPSTFEGALNASPNIEYIYVVGETGNPSTTKDVIQFIEAAVRKGGIKKFVNLSATNCVDELGTAQIPRYLKENHISYVILRPTWFTDNLTVGTWFAGALERGQFETAMPTGRIPFIAIEDIARAAFKALTEDVVNRDMIIIGPELLTYTEFAEAASDGLGTIITHRPVSARELLEIKGPWAKWLIDYEVKGEEDGIEEKWWSMSAEEADKLGFEIFKGEITVREWARKYSANSSN